MEEYRGYTLEDIFIERQSVTGQVHQVFCSKVFKSGRMIAEFFGYNSVEANRRAKTHVDQLLADIPSASIEKQKEREVNALHKWLT